MKSEIDYAETGLDIRQAMVDHAKKITEIPDRTNSILWNGIRVKTADWWDVPITGIVEVEFLSSDLKIEQGADVKVEGGWIELPNGNHISILRTWKNEKYDDLVKYNYFSKPGKICVWNVYNMTYSENQITDERWTGNAGFWVEYINENQRIYHCSHGMNDIPNFESLVFRISVERSIR